MQTFLVRIESARFYVLVYLSGPNRQILSILSRYRVLHRHYIFA